MQISNIYLIFQNISLIIFIFCNGYHWTSTKSYWVWGALGIIFCSTDRCWRPDGQRNSGTKRNKPGYDLIYRIAQTFEWLSIEWLITGNGEMVKTKGQSGTEDAYQGISLKELVDYLREKDRRIETLIRENAQLEIMCQNMHLKGAWKVSKGSRQVVFPIGKEPIVFRLLLCLSLFKV